ncbi:MAG: leucine-rich repeat domain-containing protein [Gemmatimonadota bacterium]
MWSTTLLASVWWCGEAVGQDPSGAFYDLETAAAQPSDVRALDLGSTRLTPEAARVILGFLNLETLRVDPTGIEGVLEDVDRLAALKDLDIGHAEPGTSLLTLPQGVSRLDRLESLNLNGHPKLEWSRIFGALGALPRLNNLAIMNNGIVTLPRAIRELTELRSVWLGGNLELEGRETFVTLSTLRLTALGLGGNQMRALPTEVEGLVELETLWLAGNRIESVESLAPLVSLTALVLSRNQLDVLPVGLSHLAVQSLALDENPDLDLSTALVTLSEMPRLTALSLRANNLESLPRTAELLTRLRVLDLRDNPMSAEEVDRLRTLLPDTRILFD